MHAGAGVAAERAVALLLAEPILDDEVTCARVSCVDAGLGGRMAGGSGGSERGEGGQEMAGSWLDGRGSGGWWRWGSHDKVRGWSQQRTSRGGNASGSSDDHLDAFTHLALLTSDTSVDTSIRGQGINNLESVVVLFSDSGSELEESTVLVPGDRNHSVAVAAHAELKWEQFEYTN